MIHQRTGLQISLLIHAALIVSLFGVSRMVVTPSAPIPLELGIFPGSADAPKNDMREKVVRRQRKTPITKPAAQQQQTPAETAVAEKSAAKQEQTFSGPKTNESLKTSEPVAGNNPSEVVGPVFDAEYLHNPKPMYPPLARRMKLEGIVVVRVLVNSAGKPDVVRLEKSSGAVVLDQAALNAVQGWSFIPGRQGGKPVPAWVDIPLHFRLT
jgi:protein TonB